MEMGVGTGRDQEEFRTTKQHLLEVSSSSQSVDRSRTGGPPPAVCSSSGVSVLSTTAVLRRGLGVLQRTADPVAALASRRAPAMGWRDWPLGASHRSPPKGTPARIHTAHPPADSTCALDQPRPYLCLRARPFYARRGSAALTYSVEFLPPAYQTYTARVLLLPLHPRCSAECPAGEFPPTSLPFGLCPRSERFRFLDSIRGWGFQSFKLHRLCPPRGCSCGWQSCLTTGPTGGWALVSYWVVNYTGHVQVHRRLPSFPFEADEASTRKGRASQESSVRVVENLQMDRPMNWWVRVRKSGRERKLVLQCLSRQASAFKLDRLAIVPRLGRESKA